MTGCDHNSIVIDTDGTWRCSKCKIKVSPTSDYKPLSIPIKLTVRDEMKPAMDAIRRARPNEEES